MSLLVDKDLVFGLFEGPGTLLSCPNVATEPSNAAKKSISEVPLGHWGRMEILVWSQKEL